MNTADCDERRGTPRVGFRLPILRIVGDSRHLDYTLDLSESGMGIETNEPVALGQEMHLRFVHPFHQRDLWADAVCIWLGDEHGEPTRARRGGLRFVHVDPNVRTLLAELVRTCTPQVGTGPRDVDRPRTVEGFRAGVKDVPRAV